MHVLMMTMDYPPVMGGIAAHVFELSRHMAHAGIRVTVLARVVGGISPVAPDVTGLTIIPYRLKWAAPFYGYQMQRLISRTVGAFTPDLIHLHGLGTLEGFKKQPMPVVYTNHTSGYLKKIRSGKRWQLRQLQRLFKPVNLFLAPSEELLETPFPFDVPKKYIPNGIDIGKFKADSDTRQTVRKELNIRDHELLGIVTRRMVEKNGLIYLARACGRIKTDRVRFLFIGDGETRVTVELELAEHFSGRFQMAGALTHDAIVRYYQAADFSVLPSLMEATSISGLEAMASSLPLIGTRVGGIPDLIDNGITGFLCNPGDPDDLAEKIDLMAASDFKTMGMAGYRKVQANFDWAKIVDRTVLAYRECL